MLEFNAAPLPLRFADATSTSVESAPFLLAPFGPSATDSWFSAP